MSTKSATVRDQARLSVSSWSLHRTLGRPSAYGPGDLDPLKRTADQAKQRSSTGVPLEALPAQVADFGIYTLELCHFHLPSRESDYVDGLRAALDEANVELWSFLIDGGDITDPVNSERDLTWIEEWFPVAARLGAENVRVAAGRQAPSEETLARSRRGLARLAKSSAEHGLHLMTENWLNLTTTPETVLDLLGHLDGKMRLCVDFGNWGGPDKYGRLEKLMPHAASCHAKAHFDDSGVMDRADYVRCLDLCRDHGFSGPYTLIYDGPSADEWAGLNEERATVAAYVPA